MGLWATECKQPSAYLKKFELTDVFNQTMSYLIYLNPL